MEEFNNNYFGVQRKAQNESPTLSIVIPCYHSELTIGEVVDLSIAELDDAGIDYEFVLVNDGSGAPTFEAISTIAKRYDCVIGIDLARNMGQQMATLAGLRETRGDYILVMDDDLQTHPSQIMKLVSSLKDGNNLVFAKYGMMEETTFRSFASKLSSRIAPLITGRPKGLYIGSFYGMSRYLCDKVVEYKGRNVNIQIIALMFADRPVNISVQHYSRTHGTSGYTLSKLFRAWVGLFNYSELPSRITLLLSALFGLASIFFFCMSVLLQNSMLALIASCFISSAAILISLALIALQVAQGLFSASSIAQYAIRKRVGHRGTDPEGLLSSHKLER